MALDVNQAAVERVLGPIAGTGRNGCQSIRETAAVLLGDTVSLSRTISLFFRNLALYPEATYLSDRASRVGDPQRAVDKRAAQHYRFAFHCAGSGFDVAAETQARPKFAHRDVFRAFMYCCSDCLQR